MGPLGGPAALADGVGLRLASLAASRNERYTYVGVNALLNQCERLTDLDLSACPAVTHVGVVVALRDGQVRLHVVATFWLHVHFFTVATLFRCSSTPERR